MHAKKGDKESSLMHYRDCGIQCLSIKYSGSLAEAEIDPSVGSVGDRYDSRRAETINGLYLAEVLLRHCTSGSFDTV